MENTEKQELMVEPQSVDIDELNGGVNNDPVVDVEPVNEPQKEGKGDDGELLDKLGKLIAEAEERGYQRGRNESEAHSKQKNGESESVTAVGEPQVLILNNVRGSVWD